MYQLTKDPRTNQVNGVCKDGKYGIPFDPANTDFQQFKLDLTDGVELQDAEGNTMSPEEVTELLATLP